MDNGLVDFALVVSGIGAAYYFILEPLGTYLVWGLKPSDRKPHCNHCGR